MSGVANELFLKCQRHEEPSAFVREEGDDVKVSSCSKLRLDHTKEDHPSLFTDHRRCVVRDSNRKRLTRGE